MQVKERGTQDELGFQGSRIRSLGFRVKDLGLRVKG